MKVEGADIGEAALRLVAQDLMAPLSVMRQLSFELDNDAKLCGSAAATNATAEMRTIIEQAFQLVDKLKLLSDSEHEVALEPISINGLCHDIGEELKPLTSERRCALHFAVPHRDIVVTGNYNTLKSIMRGFLTDATHYIRTPSSKDGQLNELTLKVVPHGDGLVSFLIRDNGPAINLKQSIANLATSQVATIDGRPLSSGLNLLLADNALKAMNGELLVHNHRQGGATIETRLMRSQQLTLLRGANEQ